MSKDVNETTAVLSRVDADATAPEYSHVMFAPASSRSTTVDRFGLQIATERP